MTRKAPGKRTPATAEHFAELHAIDMTRNDVTTSALDATVLSSAQVSRLD